MANGVPIDTANAVKIARQLGEQGKPLPAELAKVPGAVAAYDQAKAGAADPNAAPPAPAQPRKAPAKRAPTRKPATKEPGPEDLPAGPVQAPAPAHDTPRLFGQQALTTAGAPFTPFVKPGSTGGGVLLVLVLYPILLSVIQYGASGPGMWFRAKWLNQTSSAPSSATATPTKVPPTQVHQGQGTAGGRFPVTS